MERDDNVLEKNDVFVPKWDSESTDDTCENIEKFCGTIKFVSFVDQGVEALINCLSNHLSSWNKFGVQLVQDVFEVISLN